MDEPVVKKSLSDFLEGLRQLSQFQDCQMIGVNTRGSNGDTPLKVAVVREDLATAQNLLNAGADPNIVGEDACTPLHHAVGAGNMEIIRLLLARGASVEAREYMGKTPIDYARMTHNVKLVALLERFLSANK